jgi:seryl-tRNA synthetase
MLDIKLVRQQPERLKRALSKRGLSVDVAELIEQDEKRRSLIRRVDELRAERKRKSSEIFALAKQGVPTESLKSEARMLASEIKDAEAEMSEADTRTKELLDALPNAPDDDVPAGGKESNRVIKEWGAKPALDFDSRDHVELAESLTLIDYSRGTKLGGSGFWMYRGRGALMEWGLLNYFVEQHVRDGYEFILPPHILNYQCGYTAGQFPKFVDDVFLVEDKSGGHPQFLLPTSETALVNVHRDEILLESDLPMKYFSFTPCYRREIGSYRSEERGTIRGHQFNKVEMFQFTSPEQSDDAFDELLRKAEQLVQGLGLHYQVSKLAAEDISAAMAKTFDVEVWMPSMATYREVSSVSNARDYQARRGSVRYRKKDAKGTAFVHTLNASGLATSRLIPAIAEQFQQSDGSVTVPEVLRKWVGCEVLYPEDQPR